MRKGSIAVLLAAVWAPAAHACDITVSQASGPAPLTAVYTAACASASYQWSFGDGTTAVGQTVTHTFAAGRWGGGLLTDGGATDALPVVTSVGIALSAPRQGAYRDGVTLAGSVRPASLRVRIYRGASLVTTTAAGPQGRFRHDRAAARARTVHGPRGRRQLARRHRPREAAARGAPRRHADGRRPADARREASPGRSRQASRPRGQAHRGDGQLAPTTARHERAAPPARAGRRRRGGRLSGRFEDARRPGRLPGARHRRQRASRCASSSGASRRCTTPSLGIDGGYGQDTLDAVTAFQKVAGARRAPARSTPPSGRGSRRPRSRSRATPAGDHIEVDKTRQVLYLVRGGEDRADLAGLDRRDRRLLHARGPLRDLPEGAGLDDEPARGALDPMYFTGGYAIHGSPRCRPTRPRTAASGCRTS